MTFARSAYLIYDCCGDPGETECEDIRHTGGGPVTVRMRLTPTCRSRCGGDVLDLCARCAGLDATCACGLPMTQVRTLTTGRDFRRGPCPECREVRIIPVSLGRCVRCAGGTT